MKTVGLLGGMSWESSAHYYRLLNQGARDRLGGVHSARSLMLSVDFGEIERLLRARDWDVLGEAMATAAQVLERGGADFLVLCTNTVHRIAPAIERAVAIPLLHIVDPTAEAIRAAGIRRVGLLGTALTMQEDFYTERLSARHGLEVIVPEPADQVAIDAVIFRELVAGQVLSASRDLYRDVMARLVNMGAQGIVLGCTEIMLLVSAQDSAVPLFDTTALHAAAALEMALGG